MRLREVQWILKAAVPQLVVEGKSQRTHGNELFITIQLTGRLMRAVQRLQGLKVFAQEAKAILESVAFTSAYDDVEITSVDNQKLTSQVTSLQQRAAALLSVLDQILDDEEPSSFAYTLASPKKPRTPKETAEMVAGIEEIFGTTLRRLLATELRVGGFESGSEVVVLQLAAAVLGTAGTVGAAVKVARPALDFVARLYAGAKDLLQFRLQLAKGHEELRTLQLNNDMLENRKKVDDAATEAKLQQIARAITEAIRGDLVGPQENPHVLIQRSVGLLAEELEGGAIVQLPSNIPAGAARLAEELNATELLAPAGTRKPAPDDAPLLLTSGESGEESEPSS